MSSQDEIRAMHDKYMQDAVGELKLKFPVLFLANEEEAAKALAAVINQIIIETREIFSIKEIGTLSRTAAILQEDLNIMKQEGVPQGILAEIGKDPTKAVIDVMQASYVLALQAMQCAVAGINPERVRSEVTTTPTSGISAKVSN
jgi:hypothetical protein